MRRSIAQVAAAVQVATAWGADTSPDTSGWNCTQCPFFAGYQAEAQAGALAAPGANANYGRYTGIDRSTAYADAGADGHWRDEQGSYANYELEQLGLASRRLR